MGHPKREPKPHPNGQPIRQGSRLGRVHCHVCSQLVGLVWFGERPELVEPIPVWVEAQDGRTGLGLLLHHCPEPTTTRPTGSRKPI